MEVASFTLFKLASSDAAKMYSPRREKEGVCPVEIIDIVIFLRSYTITYIYFLGMYPYIHRTKKMLRMEIDFVHNWLKLLYLPRFIIKQAEWYGQNQFVSLPRINP